MEYMDAGSLQDLVDRGGVQSECVLKHIVYCCLVALQHMHKYKVLHRDIKPGNILVNSSAEVKVADLGLAIDLNRTTAANHIRAKGKGKNQDLRAERAKRNRNAKKNFEGTTAFLSPERLTGQDYGFAADIWALGISIICLAKGAHPYDVANYIALQQSVTCEPAPQLSTTADSDTTAKLHVVWDDGSVHCGFSAPLVRLVAGMLVKDPKRRHSASQLLGHPCMRACAARAGLLQRSSHLRSPQQRMKSQAAKSFMKHDFFRSEWERAVVVQGINREKELKLVTGAIDQHREMLRSEQRQIADRYKRKNEAREQRHREPQHHRESIFCCFGVLPAADNAPASTDSVSFTQVEDAVTHVTSSSPGSHTQRHHAAATLIQNMRRQNLARREMKERRVRNQRNIHNMLRAATTTTDDISSGGIPDTPTTKREKGHARWQKLSSGYIPQTIQQRKIAALLQANEAIVNLATGLSLPYETVRSALFQQAGE